MALGHGPTVVTNGLVLALDAADINSFDKNENLLTYSEQFDNGAWSKVSTTVSANATAAPNGTLTADNVTNTPNSLSYLAQVKSGLSTTTTYTASVYVKPLTTNKVVAFEWGGAWRSFNLSNLTDTGGGGTGQITVLDNGWYRISHTVTNVTSFNVIYIGAYGTTADTVTVALWGAQLEIGSSTSPYYATTASAKNRGSTWIDLMGNGNNGTLINGPTFSSSNSGSIAFDGTNDYVNIGVGRGINQFSADFAVSAWVMRLSGAATWGNIIGDYYTNSVATTNEWQLMMSSTAQFNFYRAGTGYVIPFTASGYSISQWINVVVSRIGSTVSMYANNNLIATATNSTVFGTATGNLNIGIDGNNSSEPLSGRISNVMIYKDKGLTAAEVQQNFNALRGRFGV